MTPGWKESLIAQYLRSTDSEELLETMNNLLPTVIDSMAPQQRAAFFQALVCEHLSQILEGVSQEERAAIVRTLRPTLLTEFPLESIKLREPYTDR
jgi:Mg/Co/Ni transporter MgtE